MTAPGPQSQHDLRSQLQSTQTQTLKQTQAQTQTPSDHAGWVRELEAMEAYLSAQRDAFSYRDVERPPLREPAALAQLGPLPASLRPRAEQLLRATRAFEGEIVDARASVATALRSAERGRRARAAYVDARA